MVLIFIFLEEMSELKPCTATLAHLLLSKVVPSTEQSTNLPFWQAECQLAGNFFSAIGVHSPKLPG
jgi:hypothetical protein